MRGLEVRGYTTGIRCRDNGQRTPEYRREQDVRIEAEAGGAARRIGPNDIRDNRRRDGREGELARS